MSDKSGCPASAQPTCPPPAPDCAPKEEIKCDNPPTLTFECPCSPPPPEDLCAPKVDECIPPPKPDECVPPPKVEECVPPPKPDSCVASTQTPPAGKNDGGFCGSTTGGTNDCEARPLSMTRDDGSSKCGPKC